MNTFKKDDLVKNMRISDPIWCIGQVIGPVNNGVIFVKMFRGVDEWNIEDIELVKQGK